MKRTYTLISGLAGLAGLLLAATASAAPVLCQTETNNHMLIDSAHVGACLDAGVGNLTGNPNNDLFLNGAGSGYFSAGKSDGINLYNIEFHDAGKDDDGNSSGWFSFDSSFWDDYEDGAIGFKFGTGGEPDEWFVYSLLKGQTYFQVPWQFINVLNEQGQQRGGGLSHVNLYGTEGRHVPEPAMLSLLGAGLIGFGLMRRRRKGA